jgi:DUF438 domain-containing protein
MPALVLGPRTTLHELLVAYPALREQLAARAGLERLRQSSAVDRWARVVTLAEAAELTDVPWRRLAADVQALVAAAGTTPPEVAGAERTSGERSQRLEELHAIFADLERGVPLVTLAARLEAVFDGLGPGEAEQLEEAARVAGQTATHEPAAEAEPLTAPAPAGHPLATMRDEGAQVRRLCDGLREELDLLGGSPSRRRWRQARPMVVRLVERMTAVEARFRRQQQAWFPALAVHGQEGPAQLLAAAQAESLELVRRLRLAVARDDGRFVVEAGRRLLELLDDVLLTEEQVLEPLAERHLSEADWVVVRELEDGVGWTLIPAPPRWPPG